MLFHSLQPESGRLQYPPVIIISAIITTGCNRDQNLGDGGLTVEDTPIEDGSRVTAVCPGSGSGIVPHAEMPSPNTIKR